MPAGALPADCANDNPALLILVHMIDRDSEFRPSLEDPTPLPAGEWPEFDQLPADEPAGPPAGAGSE